MHTSAPRNVTWLIGFLLLLVGLLSHFVVIPVLSPIALWLIVASSVLLLIATVISGL